MHDSAARILDANLNRAREALRVLDDYARFARNDRTLSEAAKRLRHDLVAAADLLPAGVLLASRDTTGDVGTEITAGGEFTRTTTGHVAHVNLKRFQESLRSLEEFGKLVSAPFAERIERLRYAAYSIERAFAQPPAARERFAATRLYVLLTEEHCPLGWERTVREAAAGGATAFQLREKALCDKDLVNRARALRDVTRELGVLFVVNDRADVAAVADADGVHLGQDDCSLADARKIVGPNVAIGVSTHAAEQVQRAVLDGADYLGIGPTFPSQTKSFDHFPGLGFVSEAASLTSLPAFVLGGVNSENVSDVRIAGGTRVAVARAVTHARDPRSAAAAILAGLNALDFPPAADR
ncbi:MAG TPA: thiamine phosphate synthase [Fimbriiglobus sp.]|jgi:thiamine-phosphate pyrophosphorylase